MPYNILRNCGGDSTWKISITQMATSDQVRIENISANQKFEAFITSLAHIVEKYGMKVLNEGDGAA